MSHLARFVGTRPWKLSSVASKAMSAITAPTVVQPDRPTRKYWINGSRMATTNNETSGEGKDIVQLVPVKDDWEHDLDAEDYKIARRSSQEQAAAWKGNKAKCYYLVLSHCPVQRSWSKSSETPRSARRQKTTKMWLPSSR